MNNYTIDKAKAFVKFQFKNSGHFKNHVIRMNPVLFHGVSSGKWNAKEFWEEYRRLKKQGTKIVV